MAVVEHFKLGGMPNQQPGCAARINELARTVLSSVEQASNYIAQAYRPPPRRDAIVCEARIIRTIPSSPESVIVTMSEQPGILKIRMADRDSSSNDRSHLGGNAFHLLSYGNLYLDNRFQMETMEHQYPVEESKNNRSGQKHQSSRKK